MYATRHRSRLRTLFRETKRTSRTGLPEDDGRQFIITYFKADRTVVVREPPKRNSGIIGGNFLSRMKVCLECWGV